jgi:hypothetical protein
MSDEQQWVLIITFSSHPLSPVFAGTGRVVDDGGADRFAGRAPDLKGLTRRIESPNRHRQRGRTE